MKMSKTLEPQSAAIIGSPIGTVNNLI